MRILRIAGLIALGLAMSGCATIIEGTTQSLSVNTPPADGAKCTLANSEGTWYVTAPGSVTVHKTKNDLRVTCTKDGFQDASTVVSPKFNGATFGNILAGGVIGVGVDAASGANYEYPSPVTVPMTAAGSAPAAPPVMQPLPSTSDKKTS